MGETAPKPEFIYYHEQLQFKSVVYEEYRRLYCMKPKNGFYLVCVKGNYLYCISKDFIDNQLRILIFNIFDLELLRHHNVKLDLKVNTSILDCLALRNGWIWLRLINEECVSETVNIKLDEALWIRSFWVSRKPIFNRNTVTLIKSWGFEQQIRALSKKNLSNDELDSLNIHCGVDLPNTDFSKHRQMRDLITQAEDENGLFHTTISCCFLNYSETIAAVVGVPQRKGTATVFSDCSLYVERGNVAEIYKLEKVYTGSPFVMQTKFNTILVIDPTDLTIESFVKVQ